MPFYYPLPNVAAYSELLFSYGFLYWPWRLIGLSHDTAFLGWIYSVAFVNFIVAYYLLRVTLAKGPIGSLLGAFVMVFAQSHLRHFDHVQLFPFFYVIGSVIAAITYMQLSTGTVQASGWQRGKWITIFFACLLGQAYGCFNVMYFLAIVLAIALVWGLVIPGYRAVLRKCFAKDYKWILANAVVVVLLLVPLARHFLATLQLVGPRDWNHVKLFLPRPCSWIFDYFSYLYAWMDGVYPWNTLPESTARWEHSFGLGLVTSLMTLYVMLRQRKKTLFTILLLTCVSFIAITTLFAETYTLWYIIWKYIPGGSAVRAIARIGMLLSIPAGIALATIISENKNTKYGSLVVYIALFCAAEQIVPVFTYNMDVCRQEVRYIEQFINKDKPFVIVIRDASRFENPNWLRFQLHAMYASNLAHVPTFNGYTSNFTTLWSNGVEDIIIKSDAEFARFEAAFSAWLSQWGIARDAVQVIEIR